MPQTAIIISISSDIGTALAHRWLGQGCAVWGTYRTASEETARLHAAGATLVPCDTSDAASVNAACAELKRLCPAWDTLVVAPGTTEPVGLFTDIDFDAWACSIEVNFTSQMRLTHRLLDARNTQSPQGACVIYFAGGGTNNATSNYSAYTVSKIGLIKMCELLHTEIPDVRFSILGPGWVNTKIHQETLRAGAMAGANLLRTQQTIENRAFTSMDNVLDCCDWLTTAPREEIGGRNFSVAHDAWNSPSLREALLADPDMYKLRRSGNRLIFDRPTTKV